MESMSFFDFVKNHFSTQKLSKEAFLAYYHRLPKNISVRWQRDGKFIVGEVSDGERTFVTQGRNPEEFIEMVNDALLTVHNIPRQYQDVVRLAKTYAPPLQVRQQLADSTVLTANFSSQKDEKVLQLA